MKIIKKMIALISGISLMLLMTINVFATKPVKFADVNESDWFYEAVQSANEFGLISGTGDGLFNPQGTLTTAEAVTLASRTHAYEDGTLHELEMFMFDSSWHWAEGYLNYAIRWGIAKRHYTLEELDTPVTRDEMSAFFANALNKATNKQINDFSSAPEQDVSDNIKLLYTLGIIIGDDNGSFRLNDYITRAETSAIIYRMIFPDERIRIGSAAGETDTTSAEISHDTTLTAFDVNIVNNTVAGESDPIYSVGISSENSGNVSNSDNNTAEGSMTGKYIPIDEIETTSKEQSDDMSILNNSNIPTNAVTGKYIPTSDPSMAQFNRKEIVDFIYTEIQDRWYEGKSAGSQSIYMSGLGLMEEAFGGIVETDVAGLYPNGKKKYPHLSSREDLNTICAGDYLSLKGSSYSKMLVAERLSNSIIAIIPYEDNTYHWVELSLDWMGDGLDYEGIHCTHLEFNGLQ